MAEETKYSIRNHIVFKDDNEDVLVGKTYGSNKCKEDEFGYNRSLRDSFVFKENIKEELPNNIDDNLDAFDIVQNTNIKTESLNEDNIQHYYENYQSIKNSIVFKEDLDDLYENHTIKEELTIGPEVLQLQPKSSEAEYATDITSENISKKIGKSNSRKRKNKITSESQDTDNKPIQPYDQECKICHKRFRLKASLEKHMEAHQNPQSVKQDHKCDICGKVYELLPSLKRHLKTHSSTSIFKCSVCNKTYTTKYSLKCHYSSKHLGERNITFKCRYCAKIFKDRSSCARHEIHKCLSNKNKSIAKPTSTFTCDICQRTFYTKRALIDHIKLHMGTPYKRKILECDLCTRKYSRKYNLRIHMASKHLNIKFLFCKKCKQGFLRLYLLKQHEQTCNGQYTSKPRNNTFSENKFICDLCSNKYKSKTGLTSHIEARHLDIRRFSCTNCNSRFTRKWSLNCHKKKCFSKIIP